MRDTRRHSTMPPACIRISTKLPLSRGLLAKLYHSGGPAENSRMRSTRSPSSWAETPFEGGERKRFSSLIHDAARHRHNDIGALTVLLVHVALVRVDARAQDPAFD